MTTETGRQPATADTQPGVEARLARLEGAIEGLGGKVELIQRWGGIAATVVVGAAALVIGGNGWLLVRTETLADRIAALSERTAVVEQQVVALQSDVTDIKGEVRATRDELTRQGVVISAIATKLDAMPQHLPPPRKPEEP